MFYRYRGGVNEGKSELFFREKYEKGGIGKVFTRWCIVWVGVSESEIVGVSELVFTECEGKTSKYILLILLGILEIIYG